MTESLATVTPAHAATPTSGTRARGSLWPVVLVASTLSLLVLCYAPAYVYSAGENERHFYFPLVQTLIPLVGAALAASIVLVIPAVFMSPRIRAYYAGFLASLTAYAWLAGFVFTRDYGLLDGRTKFPAYSPAPLFLIGTIVIGVSALVARIRPARLSAATVPVLAFLIFHLTVLTIVDSKPVRALERAKIGSFYEFGSQNLLVILLDSLQSDVFADTIEKRDDIASSLEGFTYYPNTVGVAPTTYGALPTIHSGSVPAPGESMDDHFRRSIERNSFETELATTGWKVIHVDPIADVCAVRIEHCFMYDANVRAKSTNRLLQQSASMLDLAFFRLAPPEAKAAVYNNNRWRLSSAFKAMSLQEASDLMLRDLTRGLKRRGDPKIAKFLHLQSTHAPLTRAGDCSLLTVPGTPITRSLALGASECALTRVAALMQKLQRSGIYDDTTIVILSDHGYKDMGSARLTDPKWTSVAGSANPLLLVKPPGAKGHLRTSGSALWLADIKTIVCTLTKGCPERSATWASPDPQRARYYMHYSWLDESWFASTLKDERHYVVRGPVTEASSWTDLGGLRLPVVTRLRFNEHDEPGHFGYSWGRVDHRYGDGARWAQGGTATMNLRLPAESSSRLTFDVGTLPELKGQTLTLKVNGSPVGTVEVNGTKDTVSFIVPGKYCQKDIDELHLIFGKHREGTDQLNRHRRLSQSLAVRFDELRIRFG